MMSVFRPRTPAALEFGFVRAQSAYGIVSYHLVDIAKAGVRRQIFGRLPVS